MAVTNDETEVIRSVAVLPGLRLLGRIRKVLKPPDRDDGIPRRQFILANRTERSEVKPHELRGRTVGSAAGKIIRRELLDLLGEALRPFEGQTLVGNEVTRHSNLRLAKPLDESDREGFVGRDVVHMPWIRAVALANHRRDLPAAKSFHRRLPVPEATISVKSTSIKHDTLRYEKKTS